MNTETKTTNGAAPTTSAEQTAIATTKTIEVERFVPKALDWTDARVELLRKQVTPPSATDEEFALFLDWCKATGLNPFLQQAYLIERSVNVGGGKYATKHQPQAAIGGFRALGDLQPDYLGGNGGPVYAGDTFSVDQLSGEVVHQWDPGSRAKNGQRVLGAWWHCHRRGRVTRVVFLELDSRVQRTREGKPTKFWATDPAGMITKCAEAAAWREAFPSLFSGVFLAEEVLDEREVNEPPPSGPPPATRTEALLDRLKATAAKTVDAPPAKAKGEPYLPITSVRWGTHKGRPIGDLTETDLALALSEVDATKAKIKAGSKATDGREWLDVLTEGVDAVRAEVALRARGGVVDEAREPGAEG